MSPPAPLICLVTPGHVGSAPRIVKEADSLVEAGYQVHVVAGRHAHEVDRLDADVLGSARWKFTLVDSTSGTAALARKVVRRFARRLVVHAPLATLNIASRAHHADALRLGAVAAGIPAHLYIGHCLAGLPAAARAAKARGVAYGFDAEDYHGGETEAALNDPPERISVNLLESRLLRGCVHLTAASPLIGSRYREVYGVHPATLLNVFPRAMAPRDPVEPAPVSTGRPAVAYWFSQTIGAGRGLESVVGILGRMRTPVELHVRGTSSPSYAAQLQARATQQGLARPIRFLPPGPPSEMARLAAGADLGLSTEERHPLSRDLCLTNKVFIYLLAGVPQLMSDTTAQQALAPEFGEAALLGDLSKADEVAGLLDGFFSDPARVASARRTARGLAMARFCWDVEQARYLDSVRSVAPLP